MSFSSHNISHKFGYGFTRSSASSGELKILQKVSKTLALASLSWFVKNR
jgi:hypothetical protein